MQEQQIPDGRPISIARLLLSGRTDPSPPEYNPVNFFPQVGFSGSGVSWMLSADGLYESTEAFEERPVRFPVSQVLDQGCRTFLAHDDEFRSHPWVNSRFQVTLLLRLSEISLGFPDPIGQYRMKLVPENRVNRRHFLSQVVKRTTERQIFIRSSFHQFLESDNHPLHRISVSREGFDPSI